MYNVTNSDGDTVERGDTVTDFRGDTGTFTMVTGFGRTGTPKVLVDGREYYARVWGLTVNEVG